MASKPPTAAKPPSQAQGESRDAYLQRLKEWRRRQDKGGSKIQTQGAAPETKGKESSRGWIDRLIDGLKGKG